MKAIYLIRSFALIAGFCGVAGAQSAAASSEPGGSGGKKICTAVLEPEVQADLPADRRARLGDYLDALLADSLAKRPELVAVDRQALDKVLAEQTLQHGMKLSARDAAEPIRPFWAAGVLICPAVRDASNDRLAITVDAVIAQNGQVAAQVVDLGQWNKAGWTDPTLPRKLDAFFGQIRDGVARQLGKPLVEVTDGKLVSDLARLQWMVDDLDDALRANLAADRAVLLLEPRHAASSKEERLLRMMGLSDAHVGDAAAELKPTPDARVSIELHESVEPDIAFDKTPISLRLSWQNGSAAAVNATFVGTVGQWEDVRHAALLWAQSQRATLAPGGDLETLARQLAREELGAIEQLEKSAFDDPALEQQRRYRIAEHALRAAHLDPLSEPAAYQVAMNIDALDTPPGREESFESENRILIECQRYVDRFGKVAVAERLAEVKDRLMEAAEICAGEAGPDLGLALSSRQNAEKFHYEAIALPLWVERDIADGASDPQMGNLWASSWHLRLFFIMNCPADQLDAEHERWKKIWTERVAKIPGFTPPWDLIEVFFQIRNKDWHKAREAYQRLADRYNESVEKVWKFDRWPILPHTLRAAGDPEWSTWKPAFNQNTPHEIQKHDMDCIGDLFDPPFIDSWITGQKLPVSKVVLKPELIDAGGEAPLGLLGVMDKQMWIVSPMPSLGRDAPSRVYLADVPDVPEAAKKPLDEDYWLHPREVELPIDPQAIDWPAWNGQVVRPAVSCALAADANGHPVMLLGTHAHGIARFDRDASNKWIGRSYAGKQGMPTEQVDKISACPGAGAAGEGGAGGGETWVVTGHGSKGIIVWTINPADDSMRIIFQGDYWQFVAGCESGPTRRLLISTILDPQVLAKADPDHLPIDEILDSSKSMVSCQGRLWRITGRVMTELSPRTLRPIAKPIGDSSWWEFLQGVDGPLATFGPLIFRVTGEPATFDWPATSMENVTGTWRGLFMAMDWYKSMAIYQPAPPGEKNWATHDYWIGFESPERCTVKATYTDPSGETWLTTDIGLLRINRQQIDEYCQRIPQINKAWDPTTAGYRGRWIRQDTDQHFNPNPPMWAREAARCVLQKKWDEALKWVDNGAARKSNVPIVKDWQKAQVLAPTFWRARVYAEMPGHADRALAVYDQAIADPCCTPAIEMTARICQMLVLYHDHRFAEVIERYDQTARKFPQLKSAFSDDVVQRIVHDSRDRLAVPTTQPAEKSR